MYTMSPGTGTSHIGHEIFGGGGGGGVMAPCMW